MHCSIRYGPDLVTALSRVYAVIVKASRMLEEDVVCVPLSALHRGHALV
jgi:hypothetical protein